MVHLTEIKRPSKEEMITARKSYESLVLALDDLTSDTPEIEIEETSEKIKVPLNALKLLAKILKVTGQGNPISIVPIATEMTTQAAAELLGCSRPHFVKLLEKGEIPYTMIGRHRRVKFEDVMNYKKYIKEQQEKYISEIMKSDEEIGLYDS